MYSLRSLVRYTKHNQMEFTLGVNVHALGRDSSAGLTADEVDA